VIPREQHSDDQNHERGRAPCVSWHEQPPLGRTRVKARQHPPPQTWWGIDVHHLPHRAIDRAIER